MFIGLEVMNKISKPLHGKNFTGGRIMTCQKMSKIDLHFAKNNYLHFWQVKTKKGVGTKTCSP